MAEGERDYHDELIELLRSLDLREVSIDYHHVEMWSDMPYVRLAPTGGVRIVIEGTKRKTTKPDA